MITMEPYVKKWYDGLEGGKVMGVKCKRCGSYEFPPVPVCNNCSGKEMEWVEMSGEGKMVSFSANLIVDAPFIEFGQTIVAIVQLKEGPHFISPLVGTGIDQQAELFDKLPVSVKMEIQPRTNYKYPVFRIAE